MKKIILAFAFFAAILSVPAFAQDTESAEVMLQKMKDRVKPELVKKAGITEVQAEKVIEVQFFIQTQRRQVRMDQSLDAEQKKARNAELDNARDKEYGGIPLTSEQIKAVNLYFANEQKNKAKKA